MVSPAAVTALKVRVWLPTERFWETEKLSQELVLVGLKVLTRFPSIYMAICWLAAPLLR